MPDKQLTFLHPDHPTALAVKELLEPTRTDPDFANTIAVAAAHLIATNALAKGITDPAKACEWFVSAVELNILANQKTAGSA